MTQQQQQNQQLLKQLIPQPAQANVGQVRQVQNPRGWKLPEFAKLALQFTGKLTNLADAEYWMNETEKAFGAGDISEDMKVPLAEFQLKERAND